MSSVAKGLQIFSIICLILGGVLAYGFVLQKLGFILGVIAAILLPVTVVVAPWYEGFVLGKWLPFFLLYGGLAVQILLTLIEDKLR
ncbi:MAG: hypothetical protein KIT56_03505 [Gammaproteobacteria bacterium]|nr:hypothetical protein [Gammaproteobacteria bacterium]MCW5582944.1 hypothetical protein [Gammaproteobacteria bacterium]